MCDHRFVFTPKSTKVCTLCGSERFVLTLDSYSVSSAPFDRGYSRRQRFKIKINKLFGLHSGPPAHHPVWKYLQGNRMLLNNPFDVRECLRRSNLKNKHYDDMRIFCDVFTDFTVHVSNQLQQRDRMLTEFDVIHCKWVNSGEIHFFSYAWLVRFLLKQVNPDLIAYLKPQTSKKRHLKYIQKILSIKQPLKCGGTQDCVKPKTRSPNVLSRSSSHHDPPCAVAYRLLQGISRECDDHS